MLEIFRYGSPDMLSIIGYICMYNIVENSVLLYLIITRYNIDIIKVVHSFRLRPLPAPGG